VILYFFIREYQVVAAIFLFLIAGTNIAVVAIMARYFLCSLRLAVIQCF
jgi:hypothetical protein